VLREAWEAGVVLCGGSAGALCWFAHALSGFHEGPEREITALGLLPWSCAVHYRAEEGRREAFLDAIGDGGTPGYGAGDSAALHFIGTELAEVVASRPNASAAFVSRGLDGVVVEQELAVRYLGVSAVEDAPDATALAA
jgi:peptidase E